MIQDSRKSGFTLIELLIAVAILTVVTVIGSVNLFNYYSRQNLSLTVDEIIAFLRDAQGRSLTQESGDQWGVHFSNATTTNFQLFHGPSFASSTLVMNRDLRPGVQFIAPATGSSTDVVFLKITGYPNASTSIIVALKSTSTQAYTINISAIGRISKY